MAPSPLALSLLLAASLISGCLGTEEPTASPERETPPAPEEEPGPTPDPAPPEGAPSDPDEVPPVDHSAPLAATGIGCTEAVVLVNVDAPQARAVVPASFGILGEEGGRAQVAYALIGCDELAVGTAATAPGFYSLVGVMIAAPDETAGLHLYLAWFGTNNEALVERAIAHGQTAEHVAALDGDLALQPAAAGPANTASGLVAGSLAGFSLAMDVGDPIEPVPGPAVLWHTGPFGLSRIGSTHVGRAGTTGLGTVSDGSGVASELLGAAPGQGAAFWFGFDTSIEWSVA